MKTIVLDFETFYSRDYTLKKMTTAEYVLDDRFEAIMVGYRVLGEMDKPEVLVLNKEGVRRFKALFSGPTRVVAHNATFDCAILAWRYGIVPDEMFCTMMAARVELINTTRSMALAKAGPEADRRLSQADGKRLPPKGVEVANMMGIRRSDMTPDMLASYAAYCANDVQLCARLYEYFTTDMTEFGRLSEADVRLLHETVRKAVVPFLQADLSLLAEYATQLSVDKESLLRRCGLDDRSTLMSNDKFAAMLTDLGVEPPQKISPKTGKVGYAFAKTDKAMQDLLNEPPSEAVGALVAARLGHKSTIEETRVQRFRDVGSAFSSYLGPKGGQPWIPFPLMFFGAATGRASGREFNMQNLTKKSRLREAIVAPPEHMLVVGDLSQIEARLLAFVANEKTLLQHYREGRDVYSEFASSLYGQPINADDHPDERFVGKTAVLGLGYGCGTDKFSEMIRIQRGSGFMTKAEAHRIVNAYRNQFGQITGFWRWMDTMLHMENASRSVPSEVCYDNELVVPGRVGDNFYLDLCGVRTLWYNNLRWYDTDSRNGRGQWVYDNNRGVRTNIYGGKLVENVIQAMAALVIRDVELRMLDVTTARGMPIHAVGQVHDELIYVVPERIAEAVKVILKWSMVQQPEWLAPYRKLWGEVPLACEVSIARTYKDAK